jgi:hypothetical protein
MAGDDGLCAIHGGRQDPCELGRKGGRVGKGNAAIRKLPALAQLSLRERLRGLDHETVKVACEEILAGGNQTAKMQVIRLPCDLDVYRDNDPDERERQAQIHVAAEEFNRRIDAMAERRRYWRRKQRVEIFEPIGLVELVDAEDELDVARELARRLAAVPEPIRKEEEPA